MEVTIPNLAIQWTPRTQCMDRDPTYPIMIIVISCSNLLHPVVAMGCSFRHRVHNSAHIQPSNSPALTAEFIFTFLQIKSLCVFKLISNFFLGGGVPSNTTIFYSFCFIMTSFGQLSIIMPALKYSQQRVSVNCPSSGQLYNTHNNVFRSTVHHQASST
jgi:hypothetical protein